MTFEQWMKKVNAKLVATCGLESSDLADIAYYDLFEDGLSPAEAAKEALAENEWLW